MEKIYEFHWKDGAIEYLKGTSEADAANKAGIGAAALAALDYVAVAKAVPLNYKKFTLIDKKGKWTELGNDTMFVKQALKQMKDGKNDLTIEICGHEWKVKAAVKPFEVIFKEYASM